MGLRSATSHFHEVPSGWLQVIVSGASCLRERRRKLDEVQQQRRHEKPGCRRLRVWGPTEEDVGCSSEEGQTTGGSPSSGGWDRPKHEVFQGLPTRSFNRLFRRNPHANQEGAEAEADLARMKEEVPVPDSNV